MSALWPVQVAAVTRLKATAGVVALVAQRVFDGEAPQGAALPYIVVGDQTGEPRRMLSNHIGDLDELMLHIWSAYKGASEALAIKEAVDAALALPLTITGWASARLKPAGETVLVEPDGIRHVPARYRLFTAKATS